MCPISDNFLKGVPLCVVYIYIKISTNRVKFVKVIKEKLTM